MVSRWGQEVLRFGAGVLEALCVVLSDVVLGKMLCLLWNHIIMYWLMILGRCIMELL